MQKVPSKPVITSIITIISIVTSLGLAGCIHTSPYTKKPLKCPPAPLYPAITDSELTAVSDDTYAKIVRNIVLRDTYINELKIYCEKYNG